MTKRKLFRNTGPKKNKGLSQTGPTGRRELDRTNRNANGSSQSIPGIKEESAASILAEVGTDMEQFPTADQLSSWAGLCPANHESARVKKSVRTNRGNVWLKTTLTQSAWAATNRKGSRLQSRYHSLRARCGNKRAIVALGHTLLKTIYAVLSSRTPFREVPLTAESERQEERARYHLRCLKKLGYPTPAAE